MDLSMVLREALEREASGTSLKAMTQAVAGLSDRYRAPAAADDPILARPLDVLAYAQYRMPATFGASRAALRALAASGMVDVSAIRSVVDLGGGTGAAAWAAAEVLPDVEECAVWDQVPAALELGQRLARASGVRALAEAVWQQGRIGSWQVSTGSLPVAGADLVTVSYVLSELTQEQVSTIVAEAAAAATAVVIIEPGTPDGYERVLRARDQLLAQRWRVAAPCPHQAACPLVDDWCHFAARVNRSSIHRRIKAGELSHEDEKFSYVAMVREPAQATPDVPPAPGGEAGGRTPDARPARVIRRPRKNKGFVELQVCEPGDATGGSGSTRRVVVTKKHGRAYKYARDLGWGDTIDLP